MHFEGREEIEKMGEFQLVYVPHDSHKSILKKLSIVLYSKRNIYLCLPNLKYEASFNFNNEFIDTCNFSLNKLVGVSFFLV